MAEGDTGSGATIPGDQTPPVARQSHLFPVVGIGASAGGLDVFKQFLGGVPADSGVAYVLVQHLDPNHESLMVELLARHTVIPVVEAEDGMTLEPDHAYMIPPNRFIRLADNELYLDQPTHRRGMRMPIDYFFRSLAEERGESAICAILSGTGSDGTLGLKDIKAAGGMVMVQEPDSSEYDGMPRAALSTGMVDFVFPVHEMPAAILDYIEHPYLRNRGDGHSISQSKPDTFRSIVNLLRAHTDFDFRCYKPGTIDRRIHRRMGLRQIEDPTEYLRFLRDNTDELKLLFKDLLIGVTRFFRDPEVWEALRHEVITPVVEAKNVNDAVRVWVVGCATGEEAYSLAMLVYEELDAQRKSVPVQIYATDLDSDGIDAARSGWYPASIAADVTPARLSRFFVEENEGYRVSKRLRDSVVFATQNVISDPPFSRLDLVSCRNLLIYLEAEAQNRLIELFHFALHDGGYLFLGTSESATRPEKIFEPVSKSHRIYRKAGTLKAGQGGFPITPAYLTARRTPRQQGDARFSGEGPRAETAKRILLEQFAPASVLVNRQLEVQYFHGPVRDYLDYPTGEPEYELPKLAREGLKAKLRSALTKALHENEVVEDVARSVRRNGGNPVTVRLKVRPVAHAGDEGPMLLISFQDEPERETHGEQEEVKPLTPDEASALEQVEYELQATREDLQSTIEEVETANEELKASNEEVMSMNEELQSSNEELETSREELQSLNEELTTVNNQLQEKVGELEEANNDLTNLLVSTEIATIFLDTSLKIRRFTPAASDLFHLIEGDVGRPIDDLAPRIEDPQLLEDARSVLRRLQPMEAEVKHESGEVFIRRLLPYRTTENKIDGVVITLSNVTPLRALADRLAQREAQQRTIADLGRLATSGSDIQNLLDTACQRIAEELGCPLAKVLELNADGRSLLLRAGVGWNEGQVGEAYVGAGIESQAGYTLNQLAPVVVPNLGREKRFAPPQLLVDHNVVSGASVVIGQTERPWGVLAVHDVEEHAFSDEDANFLQSVANVLHEALERERITTRLALALEAAELAIWDWDPASDEAVWHPRLRELLGVPPDTPAYGAAFFARVHPDDAPGLKERIDGAIERRERFADAFRIVRPNGEIVWLSSFGMAYESSAGKVRVVGFNRDITSETLAQEQLAESEERYRLALQATADIVYDWDLKTDTVLRSEGMYAMIGVAPDDAPPRRDWWLERIHRDDLTRVNSEIREALAAGDEYYEHTYRVRHEEDGSWVHVLDQGMVLYDDEGDPVRVVGSRRDISERIALDERLHGAEERRRLALEATATGTWEWRVGADEMSWDPRQCEIFGIDAVEEVSLDEVRAFIHPDDADHRDSTFKQAVEKNEPYECEFRLRGTEGSPRWIAEKGDFVSVGGETRLIGISYDVTEAKEAQARDAMLMAELDHRVKNILANILAVARSSSKGKNSIEEFMDALEGRLQALSRIHTLLSSTKWSGVEIQALLEEILAPYGSPGGKRLKLGGPSLLLKPSAAQSFALTIHELTTNAVKYGALSKEEGTVAVEWKFVERDDASTVEVSWTERDGPSVAEPDKKSFGLTAIENVLVYELDAAVDMNFQPEGLTCRLSIPSDRFVQRPPAAEEAKLADADAAMEAPIDALDEADERKLRVLIVEDQWTLALELKATLESRGHEVVGPATNLQDGLDRANGSDFDAALLDVQLGDEKVFPIAEVLSRRDIPFAFVSGYTDPVNLPIEYRDRPYLNKPYENDRLASVLKQIASAVGRQD